MKDILMQTIFSLEAGYNPVISTRPTKDESVKR